MSGSRVIKDISKLPYSIGLERVVAEFPFKVTRHYLKLINMDDPNDPLRRLVIPDVRELEGNGAVDPSNEAKYTVAPGLQHKYKHTALLLLSDKCASYCRYCSGRGYLIMIMKKQESIFLMLLLILKNMKRSLIWW